MLHRGLDEPSSLELFSRLLEVAAPYSSSSTLSFSQFRSSMLFDRSPPAALFSLEVVQMIEPLLRQAFLFTLSSLWASVCEVFDPGSVQHSLFVLSSISSSFSPAFIVLVSKPSNVTASHATADDA